MSSMRSWILQLWPPLPAHEALLTLALGILSSMQPSSLAHTSACHYRPFPSDFGFKVHKLMHSSSSSKPPVFISHTHLPFYVPLGSLVCFPPEPLPFCFFTLGALESWIPAEIFVHDSVIVRLLKPESSWHIFGRSRKFNHENVLLFSENVMPSMTHWQRKIYFLQLFDHFILISSFSLCMTLS